MNQFIKQQTKQKIIDRKGEKGMEKGRNSHIAILKLSQPLGHILASIHACAFFWFIIYFSDNFNEYTHFSNGNCYSYDSSIFHHSVICVRVLECMCAYWSLLFLTVFGKESCFFSTNDNSMSWTKSRQNMHSI